jgi:hypothetical protein
MTKNELKELMEYLSAIDNRQLTAEKLQVWFDLIGFLDFPDAKAAVIEAQRDECKRLLTCDECCRNLAIQAGLIKG